MDPTKQSITLKKWMLYSDLSPAVTGTGGPHFGGEIL